MGEVERFNLKIVKVHTVCALAKSAKVQAVCAFEKKENKVMAKAKKAAVAIIVHCAADAKAIRCDGVHAAVEIVIGLKQLVRMVKAVTPVLREIGLGDAAAAAEAFSKSVPEYMGKPEKIEITTLANADIMLPEIKKDLNDFAKKVTSTKRV